MAQIKKGILDKEEKSEEELIAENLKAVEEGKELSVPLAQIKKIKAKYRDSWRNPLIKGKYKGRYKETQKRANKKYAEKNREKINARRRARYQEKKCQTK